jgi:hypothetical protein
MADHTAEILEEIAAERARQVELGWTIEHDNRYGVHHLVALSEKYAHRDNDEDPGYYSRDNLVKAATLLVAAIERLDRGKVD